MTSNNHLFDSIWKDLRLFEKKILMAIGHHVRDIQPKGNAYTMHIVDFELDNLNPSDITERLSNLKSKTVTSIIDSKRVQVPLITDLRYEDLNKTVTFTFNSLLRPSYEMIAYNHRLAPVQTEWSQIAK